MEKLRRKFAALSERPARVQFIVYLILLMTVANFAITAIVGSWITFVAVIAGVLLLYDYWRNIDKDEKDYNKYHG